MIGSRYTLASSLLLASLLALPLNGAVAVLLAVMSLAAHPRRFHDAARRWIPAVASLIVLGMATQLMQAVNPWRPPPLPDFVSHEGSVAERRDQSPNLFDPSYLAGLRGWNRADGPNEHAAPLVDGMWRLSRSNPATGRENREFLTRARQVVEPGRMHTLSVYYRHDGEQALFELVVRLPDGSFLRPTTVHLQSAEGVGRAYVTFAVPEDVSHVRALHVADPQGDWTGLDLGFVQLEVGEEPTPFAPLEVREPPSRGAAWWLGVGLLSLLGLALGSSIRTLQLERESLAALSVGTFVHLAVAGAELATEIGTRAAGLLSDPNLLGHTGVAIAVLGTTIGGRREIRLVVLLQLLTSAVVLASGSRIATVALAPLLLYSAAASLRSGRRLLAAVIVTVALAGLVVVVSGGNRFADAAAGAQLATAERNAAWEVAISAAGERPWAGIGVGNFPAYYQSHVPAEPGWRPVVHHAHNVVLSLLAESGAVGLIGFLGFWAVVGWRLLRVRALPALFAIALVLAMNVFDMTFFFTGVFVPLLVACGYFLPADGAGREADERIERAAVVNASGADAGGIRG